ncbi:MAG: MupG family TIM beta-alpha barrel fold protein [Carnobacterium sp.]|uniref:DUF871 domain-containing protein n=1 Tax=Carnobacterium sp. TaxID=48221 RepID=UPI002FC7348B
MKNIGISIYPAKSTFEKDKEYLTLASKYGFTRVFMSLLEVEGDTTEVVEKFKKAINYANSVGIETVLDINPGLFGQLGVSYSDLSFFKELGASAIRLDLGFTGAEEAHMTQNPERLKIEVNMSSGTKYIDNVMSNQPNRDYLTASHNFYPQLYSGLSQEHFEKTTAQFNQYNLHTAAFVTAKNGKLGPWPVQAGLCTLEQHRYLPIHTQVTHYKLMDSIDDLLIGNAYAAEEELKAVAEAYLGAYPQLKIEFTESATDLEKKVILEEIHSYRGDRSEYMIRSSMTRVKYKNEDFPAHQTGQIKKGDILICNDQFGQYKGETQIALKEMEDDGTRNIVGRIKEEAVFLLDYLPPSASFCFVE